MAKDDLYSLGEDNTAADTYQRLAGRRASVEDMGRRMAELTVPSIFPPDQYKAGDNLPGNNQSAGAICVNNLASALMFMAFPPGQPIFRLEAVEYEVQAQIDEDPELWAKSLLALSRTELAHRKRLQTTTLATAYNGFLKCLIVAGNALWKHLKLEEPTFHRPDCYVVKRNIAGLPLLIIHKEPTNLQSLDADHQDFIQNLTPPEKWQAVPEWERVVDIYSVCKLRVSTSGEKTWLYWEEYEGNTLPGTEVETDFEYPPMHAGWLIPVYGDDWGRGYCEEYRGDLYTLEAHASALNDGASLAALSLLFVKPGATTSIRQVRQARNLEVLPGDGNDLTTFRSDKTADLNFVLSNMEMISRRLNAAFLLQSAIQRSGERVTAEEVRRIGQELDKALGGLYTQISQGNQRVIIMRAVRLNEEENPKLPALPRDLVELQVVTGIDALGQSTEADSLMEYATAGKQAFPETFEAIHDGRDFFTRLAAAKGIKPDGLLKTEERMAQETEAAQQEQAAMSMVDKGTGPAVKGLADALASQNGGGGNPA